MDSFLKWTANRLEKSLFGDSPNFTVLLFDIIFKCTIFQIIYFKIYYYLHNAYSFKKFAKVYFTGDVKQVILMETETTHTSHTHTHTHTRTHARTHTRTHTHTHTFFHHFFFFKLKEFPPVVCVFVMWHAFSRWQDRWGHQLALLHGTDQSFISVFLPKMKDKMLKVSSHYIKQIYQKRGSRARSIMWKIIHFTVVTWS